MKFFSIDELLSGAMLWLCNLGILIISSVLCQVSDELIAMTSTHDPLYTCQWFQKVSTTFRPHPAVKNIATGV